MVDYEQAFNWQNHNIIITILSDMGVPGWLLNIVEGFHKNRVLIVTYKGTQSDAKNIPGGGPQEQSLACGMYVIY